MEYPTYVIERKSYMTPGLLYYKCNICSKVREYISAHMDYHLVSQVHKKNMEKHAQYYCETCQVQCNKPIEYRRHVETKSHKQKTGVEPVEVKPELKCEPCGVKFLCKREEERHLLTKKHAKLINQKKQLTNAFLVL
jgi:hypothetical protein